MTQPAYAVVPVAFTTPKPCTFTAANSTIAKVVIEPVPANTGATPPLTGGCSVFSLTATSTDAAAKELLLYVGKVLSTGQFGTTTSTITRATGSFITDGWLVGDALMLFTPAGTAQISTGIDGIPAILTTVATLTLTVNGTPFTANAALTAGTRIVNVSQLFRQTIAANAGNVAGTRNVALLGAADDNQSLTEWKLGSDTMLIAAMGAAVSALPAQVTISSRGKADY